MNTIQKIERIENRFKIVNRLSCDLTCFPIKEDVQFDTNKDKSRDFAEVFTPINIVDEMINIIPNIDLNSKSIDLCSGYGQFSVRLIRKMFEDFDDWFSVNKFFSNHLFNELQISSCCKLLWIFGSNINLAIGDALKLARLPKKAKGIWYYVEEIDEWVDLTYIIKKIFEKSFHGNFRTYNIDFEKKFIRSFEFVTNKINKNTGKGFKMIGIKEIKEAARTRGGRQAILSQISKWADEFDNNWQDVETPEDIVREMVNIVPEIEQKKILVLFNIEFLEQLIKAKGIDPSHVTFGYDSKAEGAIAKLFYGVDGFDIGRNLEQMINNTPTEKARRNK